jgi:hypothetical protein
MNLQTLTFFLSILLHSFSSFFFLLKLLWQNALAHKRNTRKIIIANKQSNTRKSYKEITGQELSVTCLDPNVTVLYNFAFSFSTNASFRKKERNH